MPRRACLRRLIRGVHTFVAPRLLERSEFASAVPDQFGRQLDVPLALVDPNPHNPRGSDLGDASALADNIRAFGLLQPVLVRRIGPRYQLLAGHRHFAAFGILHERAPHEARWRSIPVVVREDDDDQAFMAMMSAQLHVRAWTPRQEAAALERLVATGLTPKNIAGVVHKTQAWVSKRLRIYTDPVLSSHVQTGQLTFGVAEELLPIHEPARRHALVEKAVRHGWSEVVARAEVRRARDKTHPPTIGRRAEELRDLLAHTDPEMLSHKDLGLLDNLRTLIDELVTNQPRQGHR